MKTYILGALFGITSMVMMTSTAIAMDPEKLNQQALKLSCDFRNAIFNGPTAISQLFFDLAHKFPEPTRKSVTVQMQGQLKGFTFETTNVYEIANLDGLMVEHLIAAGSKDRGTVYFRLRYEPFSQKMTLYHFNFQDKYKAISETKFLQPPSRLQCPDI